MKALTNPDRKESSTDWPPPATVQMRRSLAAIMLVGFIASVAWWGVQFAEQGRRPESRAIAVIPTGLDPNTATWFELAQLPGLGESAGRAIVAYREERVRATSRPAFRRAADLEPVPGIGQRTIERIAAHLYFGATQPAASQPRP